MASFVDKIKVLLAYFLASQDNKYITTEHGLRLLIGDFSAIDKNKGTGIWATKTKATGTWVDKSKTP